MSPLIQLLCTKGTIAAGDLAGQAGLGVAVRTCTLWAPACTIGLFEDCYRPAIKSGQIERFALFTLTDKVEQDDDCANIYHKSLLYLVSHAFEEHMRNSLVPLTDQGGLEFAGEPIFGMEWWISRTPTLKNFLNVLSDPDADPAREPSCVWVKSPNGFAEGSRIAAAALHHGDFDDDHATVKATLARILGRKYLPTSVKVQFEHTDASNRDRRDAINR